MEKSDIPKIKNSILRCLTQDFAYGKTKTGKPLQHPRRNQALFHLPEGSAVFGETDLQMVMNAVVLGIYLAYGDSRITTKEDE